MTLMQKYNNKRRYPKQKATKKIIIYRRRNPVTGSAAKELFQNMIKLELIENE